MITLRDIEFYVNKHSGYCIKSINSRHREHVYIRRIFFKIAKEFTKCTLSEIGACLNKKHETVLHSIRKFNEIKNYEPEFYNIYLNVKNDLENKTDYKEMEKDRKINITIAISDDDFVEYKLKEELTYLLGSCLVDYKVLPNIEHLKEDNNYKKLIKEKIKINKLLGEFINKNRKP